jgi:hypothetical protein
MLPAAPNLGPKLKCKALYAWDAQTDTELSFDADEVIEIINKFEGQTQYEGTTIPL